MNYNLNKSYGVTEVFVKHDYYSKLRIKLVRKVNGKLFLCQYLGNQIKEIKQIKTDKKLYPIPDNFLSINVDESYFYFYESGDYSFFRYKYIKHQGSSRSSKSFSLEESSIRVCEERPNTRFTIWRDTQTSLGDTIWQDFRQIFPLSGREYKFTRNTTPIYFNNGSVIEPHGDDTTNAHGLGQYIAWLNEPYKMSKYTFDQIDMRSEQIWIDMNPTGQHWSDRLDNHPRCKVIHSTFEQNPFCPIEMRLKILSYDPSNPINVQNGTADDYMWKVYGLGVLAEKEERVYKGWSKISVNDFNDIQLPTVYAIDWGVNHKFAIVKCKYNPDINTLYCHELNYKSERELMADLPAEYLTQVNANGGIIIHTMQRIGIPYDAEIVCDSARPDNIRLIRDYGWEIAYGVSKPAGSLITSVSLLQGTIVKYTDTSWGIDEEQKNYSFAKDRKGIIHDELQDDNNHALDAIRYARLHFERN